MFLFCIEPLLLLFVGVQVVAKDSMVQCVAEAIRCTGLLSKGLRREFSSYARHFCPLVLEKFKEKNANVCSACHEALDFFHRYSFHLTDVQDDVVGRCLAFCCNLPLTECFVGHSVRSFLRCA